MADLSYTAAFIFGVSAGLRVFAAPAVLYLTRGSKIGYVLGILALAEFAGDALPRVPARTTPPLLLTRLVSASFLGWAVSNLHGSPLVGVPVGIFGALLGSYGGLRVRATMMKAIGALAAVLEDLVAILMAVFAAVQS